MESRSPTGIQIIEEIEAVRQDYHRLVNSIPVNLWEHPTSNPAWNVRQLIWHMILALKMLPEDLWALRKLRRQLPLPPDWIFHPLNRLVTRLGARRLNPARALQQYDAAHANVARLAADLQEDEWQLSLNYPRWDPNLSGTVTIERLFHYPRIHFDEHAAQVNAALDFMIDRNPGTEVHHRSN